MTQWITYTRIVGDVIAATRISQSKSQAQLASRTNLSNATLSRLERGLQPVSVEQLIDIGGALGVTPSQIMAEADRLTERLFESGVDIHKYRPDKPIPTGFLAFGAGALVAAAALLSRKEEE